MSSSLFSQIGFPKKTLIEKDTVVCISINQVKYLNLLKVNYDECLEINDTLLNLIKKDSILIVSQSNLIKSLSFQSQIQKGIIDNCDSQKVILNSDIEKLKRQIKIQKIKTGILGGSSLVIIGIITALLVLK